ncbi:response regulator [bacterium]|nr:response regulator [bacterium]
MRKILIIDDEESLVTLLTEVLEMENFLVHSASSGVQALEMLKKSSYSLIITDIMMPEMDGIALIDAIISKYSSLKIIIMSGWFDENELQHLHEKDDRLIRAILTKPFSPIALRDLVLKELAI